MFHSSSWLVHKTPLRARKTYVARWNTLLQEVQVWLSCYRQNLSKQTLGFSHIIIFKKKHSSNLKLTILRKLSLFGSLWFLHPLLWSSYIYNSHIKPCYYEIRMLENNVLSDISILEFSDSCRTVKQNCMNSTVTCFHLCCLCHVFVCS